MQASDQQMALVVHNMQCCEDCRLRAYMLTVPQYLLKFICRGISARVNAAYVVHCGMRPRSASN